MQPFTYDALPGRVVFGAGTARARLAGEVSRLGTSRLLLITTPRAEPLARELATPLGGQLAGVFTGVREHVPAEAAGAARQQAAVTGADALLSIGGGSATGTAKAVALTTGLPVIAVPTTYAGSEVTPVWGLTEGERKTTGSDPRVLPRVVIYDPELTVSLPAGLTAASGLNALAHCAEAFWAPGRNPVTALAAAEGLRVLALALPLAVKDGADLDARGDLLYGAYLAGAAFGVTGAGLHHKLCHLLGGRYGLPHAQTHAIVLPYVLAMNLPGAPDAADRISQALDSADPAATVQALAGWACPAGCATSGWARTRSTRRPGSSSRPCPRTTRCRPGRASCARCCAPRGRARRWPAWRASQPAATPRYRPHGRRRSPRRCWPASPARRHRGTARSRRAWSGTCTRSPGRSG